MPNWKFNRKCCIVSNGCYTLLLVCNHKKISVNFVICYKNISSTNYFCSADKNKYIDSFIKTHYFLCNGQLVNANIMQSITESSSNQRFMFDLVMILTVKYLFYIKNSELMSEHILKYQLIWNGFLNFVFKI